MKKYILIIMLAMVSSSCNDWFEVTSNQEIRKDEHFKTVRGFQQSLTGCYITMANNALYKKNLSWYSLEIMAHQYTETNDEVAKKYITLIMPARKSHQSSTISGVMHIR